MHAYIVAGLHDCILPWRCCYIAAGLHDYMRQAYTVALHSWHLAANALLNVFDWWLIGGDSWPQNPGLWGAGSGMMPLARMCGRTRRMSGTAVGAASMAVSLHCCWLAGLHDCIAAGLCCCTAAGLHDDMRAGLHCGDAFAAPDHKRIG